MKTQYDMEHEDLTSPGSVAAIIVAITLASVVLIGCAFAAVIWIGG